MSHQSVACGWPLLILLLGPSLSAAEPDVPSSAASHGDPACAAADTQFVDEVSW